MCMGDERYTIELKGRIDSSNSAEIEAAVMKQIEDNVQIIFKR